MTTGPDNRRVPAWQGYRRLSSVNSSFTYTFSGVDLTARTWTGAVRQFMTSATAESVTVSISAVLSGSDTVLTITLTGTQLDALVGDDIEWAGWLGVSCTGTPIYGLDGEILVENVVNRT